MKQTNYKKLWKNENNILMFLKICITILEIIFEKTSKQGKYTHFNILLGNLIFVKHLHFSRIYLINLRQSYILYFIWFLIKKVVNC